MKQRRFKLIKEYPGFKGWIGAETKYIGNNEFKIKLNGRIYGEKEDKYDLGYFTSFSEFWQEIEGEPILITEDGKELFEGDEFWSVDKRDWKLRKEKAANKAGDCYFLDFSTKELAQKWIEENKPKWSNNDIKKYFNYLKYCAFYKSPEGKDLFKIDDLQKAFNEWRETKR